MSTPDKDFDPLEWWVVRAIEWEAELRVRPSPMAAHEARAAWAEAAKLADPERVVCVAILHADGRRFALPRPARHHQVIALMGPAYLERRGEHVQGFITSLGRFVNRRRARQIAELAKQLSARAWRAPQLTSEDVW